MYMFINKACPIIVRCPQDNLILRYVWSDKMLYVEPEQQSLILQKHNIMTPRIYRYWHWYTCFMYFGSISFEIGLLSQLRVSRKFLELQNFRNCKYNIINTSIMQYFLKSFEYFSTLTLMVTLKLSRKLV